MALYREPQTLAVARLIGSPAINTLSGRTTGARFEGPLMCTTPVAPHGEVVLAVRPEHLVLGAAMDAAPATVLLVEPLGPESLVRLKLRSGDVVVARVAGEATCRMGDDVGVRVATGEGHCFRAADGTRLT